MIETNAIETFPKISGYERSSGNFCTLSSSPFPKAMKLKRRSPEIFVSRLFDKFMPFYPTLAGYRRFRFTRRLGPWTPLTSNPSSALSAVLKTGENGGWSTAVVHSRMRYSPSRISRRWYDRASELCTNALALRVYCIIIILPASVRRLCNQVAARLPFDKQQHAHTTSTFLFHSHSINVPVTSNRVQGRPRFRGPYPHDSHHPLGAHHRPQSCQGSGWAGSSARCRACCQVRPIFLFLLHC